MRRDSFHFSRINIADTDSEGVLPRQFLTSDVGDEDDHISSDKVNSVSQKYIDMIAASYDAYVSSDRINPFKVVKSTTKPMYYEKDATLCLGKQRYNILSELLIRVRRSVQRERGLTRSEKRDVLFTVADGAKYMIRMAMQKCFGLTVSRFSCVAETKRLLFEWGNSKWTSPDGRGRKFVLGKGFDSRMQINDVSPGSFEAIIHAQECEEYFKVYSLHLPAFFIYIAGLTCYISDKPIQHVTLLVGPASTGKSFMLLLKYLRCAPNTFESRLYNTEKSMTGNADSRNGVGIDWEEMTASQLGATVSGNGKDGGVSRGHLQTTLRGMAQTGKVQISYIKMVGGETPGQEMKRKTISEEVPAEVSMVWVLNDHAKYVPGPMMSRCCTLHILPAHRDDIKIEENLSTRPEDVMVNHPIWAQESRAKQFRFYLSAAMTHLGVYTAAGDTNNVHTWIFDVIGQRVATILKENGFSISMRAYQRSQVWAMAYAFYCGLGDVFDSQYSSIRRNMACGEPDVFSERDLTALGSHLYTTEERSIFALSMSMKEVYDETMVFGCLGAFLDKIWTVNMVENYKYPATAETPRREHGDKKSHGAHPLVVFDERIPLPISQWISQYADKSSVDVHAGYTSKGDTITYDWCRKKEMEIASRMRSRDNGSKDVMDISFRPSRNMFEYDADVDPDSVGEGSKLLYEMDTRSRDELAAQTLKGINVEDVSREFVAMGPKTRVVDVDETQVNKDHTHVRITDASENDFVGDDQVYIDDDDDSMDCSNTTNNHRDAVTSTPIPTTSRGGGSSGNGDDNNINDRTKFRKRDIDLYYFFIQCPEDKLAAILSTALHSMTSDAVTLTLRPLYQSKIDAYPGASFKIPCAIWQADVTPNRVMVAINLFIQNDMLRRKMLDEKLIPMYEKMVNQHVAVDRGRTGQPPSRTGAVLKDMQREKAVTCLHKEILLESLKHRHHVPKKMVIAKMRTDGGESRPYQFVIMRTERSVETVLTIPDPRAPTGTTIFGGDDNPYKDNIEVDMPLDAIHVHKVVKNIDNAPHYRVHLEEWNDYSTMVDEYAKVLEQSIVDEDQFKRDYLDKNKRMWGGTPADPLLHAMLHHKYVEVMYVGKRHKLVKDAIYAEKQDWSTKILGYFDIIKAARYPDRMHNKVKDELELYKTLPQLVKDVEKLLKQTKFFKPERIKTIMTAFGENDICYNRVLHMLTEYKCYQRYVHNVLAALPEDYEALLPTKLQENIKILMCAYWNLNEGYNILTVTPEEDRLISDDNPVDTDRISDLSALCGRRVFELNKIMTPIEKKLARYVGRIGTAKMTYKEYLNGIKCAENRKFLRAIMKGCVRMEVEITTVYKHEYSGYLRKEIPSLKTDCNVSKRKATKMHLAPQFDHRKKRRVVSRNITTTSTVLTADDFTSSSPPMIYDNSNDDDDDLGFDTGGFSNDRSNAPDDEYDYNVEEDTVEDDQPRNHDQGDNYDKGNENETSTNHPVTVDSNRDVNGSAFAHTFQESAPISYDLMARRDATYDDDNSRSSVVDMEMDDDNLPPSTTSKEPVHGSTSSSIDIEGLIINDGNSQSVQ